MAVNVSTLMTGAAQIAAHPVTKGTALATLITAGLFIASACGVAIPGVAFTVAPVAGLLLYNLLPKNVEIDLDDVAQQVEDAALAAPQFSDTFPDGKNGQKIPVVLAARGQANSNINQG